MKLQFTSNLGECFKRLNALELKQIPYATARTLTKLAQEVQAKTIEEELPGAFTLRKPWFHKANRFGIKIQPATTKDLIAQVYTRAPWLPIHQAGGTHKAVKAKRLAVPTVHIRAEVKKIIPKGRRIRAFKINPRRTFMITTKKQKISILFQRVGRRKRSKIHPLYILKPSVQIPKALRFYELAEQMIKARVRAIFREQFQEAVRTAK